MLIPTEPPAPLDTARAQRTVASALAERIRADIVRGALRPHAKLKLRELAARYRVGVIPLREALSRLARSGLVVAEDQRGFRVTGVSVKELLDITTARGIIEVEALRDAIAHGTAAGQARIRAALARLGALPMTTTGDATAIDPAWEAAHVDFHDALLADCSSNWLVNFATTLREHTARYRHLSVAVHAEPARDVRGEHTALAEAVLARDSATACALLAEHIATTSRLVLDGQHRHPWSGTAAPRR
jgi:DNA-binding GntR family transcriptional regulator